MTDTLPPEDTTPAAAPLDDEIRINAKLGTYQALVNNYILELAMLNGELAVANGKLKKALAAAAPPDPTGQVQ